MTDRQHVKLVDVDNKYRESKRRGKRFPNLALMKISAYEKVMGNEVGFEISNPDKTYISCVFTRNRLYAIKECCDVENGITFGGSGLSLNFALPPQVDLLKPDYDLYQTGPWKDSPHFHMSMGFTSRGCPRNCEWCIVPEKEGKFRRVQHMKEFHDSRFKFCKLLDNNILADRDWFFENTNWAIDHKVKIDITQGMDIRFLTDEIAEQLHQIMFIDGQMRFAWDRLDLEGRVKSGIEMLKDHGIKTHRNVRFFVLCGYHKPGDLPEPFCKDVYRCNRLIKMGVMPYVMPYEGGTPLINALARWSNRVTALKSTPFYRYDRMPVAVAAEHQQQEGVSEG
jgi:hypothetical protein